MTPNPKTPTEREDYEKISINLVALISLLVLFSCNSTQQKKEQVSAGQPQKASSIKIGAQDIAPGHCRIIGTIVSIDAIQKTGNADDPCSKEPCRAVVRVESVLGYGQGFIRPLSKSKEVPITFKFTLSPTKDLFQNMTKTYPGLEVGSKFLADVEAHELIGTKTINYLIYGYEIQKAGVK
ncbi:hypothetical protein IH970_14590 [candidate division KSB1 bacterium]|nr:hypothetical protein [candidate division KSB1 bacterium]